MRMEYQSLVDISDDAEYGGHLLNNFSSTNQTIMRGSDTENDLDMRPDRNSAYVERRLGQRISRLERTFQERMENRDQEMNNRLDRLTAAIENMHNRRAPMDESNENDVEVIDDVRQPMARPEHSVRRDPHDERRNPAHGRRATEISRRNPRREHAPSREPQRIALRHDAVCTDDDRTFTGNHSGPIQNGRKTFAIACIKFSGKLQKLQIRI